MLSFFRSRLQGSASALPVDPQKAADIPNYIEAFEACAKYSVAKAPSSATMTLSPTQDDPQRLAPAIEHVILTNKITESDFRASAGQCLKWAHFLAPHIAAAAGVEAWPTLGQLWKGDRKVWGPTWRELELLMKDGFDPEAIVAEGGGGLNVHAWVTLETGEIVDLTFASTLAVVKGQNYADLLGVVSYGPEDRVFNEHRYYPMLAGATAIEALQDRSQLSFLANERDELGQLSFALV